ncbi:MAG: riboflavin synthase [Gemmataceae bacterium]
MFTGLIETMGEVRRAEADACGGRRLTLRAPFASELALGESVAVNGTCLTVVARDADSFAVEAGPETLLRTNLGRVEVGHRVNLERSLKFGDRLGGHMVQGHVDGVGTLVERLPQGEWQTLWFALPPKFAAQMVSKGSVAVDGVSLTLVDVLADRFSVALIPHTLAETTLGTIEIGAPVNIETDLIGKYVAKWMESGRS